APAAEISTISLTPVASVKQIMKGIVGPAATAVFDSVSTTVTKSGTEEKAPQTAEEWEALGNSAAALIEAGNLILMGNRAVDQGDWVRFTREQMEAGKKLLKATQAKSPNDILIAGETLNASCDTRHAKCQR